MTYTENLNNEDQERKFLHLPIRSWKKRARSKPTKYEKMKLQKAREENETYGISDLDVPHEYGYTRLEHKSDEPCKSPYCGVCYDDFINDFEIQKDTSETRGFKTKLCQSSIKMLEEKYGHDAYKIFRNRYSSNRRYNSSKQHKKAIIQKITKDDVEKLIEKFGGINQFQTFTYL